ncbi:hypothetical protein KCP73_09245 [Salmonella enterica subsp. enterica]|nr:hypothetical protein KCP73_09245 [Salmonella enterica subsp. enterica]
MQGNISQRVIDRTRMAQGKSNIALLCRMAAQPYPATTNQQLANRNRKMEPGSSRLKSRRR